MEVDSLVLMLQYYVWVVAVGHACCYCLYYCYYHRHHLIEELTVDCVFRSMAAHNLWPTIQYYAYRLLCRHVQLIQYFVYLNCMDCNRYRCHSLEQVVDHFWLVLPMNVWLRRASIPFLPLRPHFVYHLEWQRYAFPMHLNRYYRTGADYHHPNIACHRLQLSNSLWFVSADFLAHWPISMLFEHNLGFWNISF